MLLEEEAIAEAKESFSQAIHCREAVVGPYDAEVVFYKSNFGLFLQDAGFMEQAEKMFLDSMSFMEQVLGLQNPNGCKALENIAYFYQVKGDIPMMINYLRRALFTYRKVYGNQFSKSNELRDLLFALIPYHPLIMDDFVLRASELFKFRGTFKAWKPRMLLLDGLLGIFIMYKGSEQRGIPKYVVRLESVNQVQSVENRRPFCFAIKVADHTHIFAAASQEEKEQWLLTINNALYSTQHPQQ